MSERENGESGPKSRNIFYKNEESEEKRVFSAYKIREKWYVQGLNFRACPPTGTFSNFFLCH